MPDGTILIVDDKVKLCKILAHDFQNVGYACLYATNAADAINAFLANEVQVVLLDLKLGDEDGIDVLRSLMEVNRNVPVIMVTGYATIESAVEAIKIGAFDYIQKPVNFTKLQRVVENALANYRLKEENSNLRTRLLDSSNPIISRDRGMVAILNKLTRLAKTDYPILLYGESGTGKELFADFIHMQSTRAASKLFKLNCASLPDSLLDNELFGHDRGAYTGADSNFIGVFERADKSSLFLDEIGDMPMEIQSKILRTLQNHEVRRLGGKETYRVDVRFIAATNKDIRSLVKQGRFREDLFYRLNAAMMQVPALRDRRGDIPLLLHHFLAEHAGGNVLEAKRIDPSVMEMLTSYPWPGNIRELKNVINFAATIATSPVITLGDLPPYLLTEPNE
ncbi:MAG TPA: sigma-54 dependent transcriptional regulator, partial [Spirochaetia bacterium]|nr:sigma-54 dependent transcriptional regulator [Spirochaetia bacterium]